MPFNLVDLGNAIKGIRKSRKSRRKPGKPMTQYELAELAKIPSPCLSNIENGKYRNPTWRMLSKIAVALGCDIADFFVRPEAKVSASQIALEEMIDTIIKERLENIFAERIVDRKPKT
jgi:transcriptional regulator with XRE-family HTH domain